MTTNIDSNYAFILSDKPWPESVKTNIASTIWPQVLGFHVLIHCGLLAEYGNIYLCQHRLKQLLMSDSNKPLPEAMLTSHRSTLVAIPDDNVTENAKYVYPWYEFDNRQFDITAPWVELQ